MDYTFFWMGECGSYSLNLNFSSINEAKNFARALVISKSVDLYGVEIYSENDESSRVYGVSYRDGELFEF